MLKSLIILAPMFCRHDMSLISVLQNYNKDNYKLSPVFVDSSDYNTYYGGISNGLLWPSLHKLPEYICKDYDNPVVSILCFDVNTLSS